MSQADDAVRIWTYEPEDGAGARVDKHVAEHLDQPRSRIQRWLQDGAVRVDGQVAKASTKLSPGQTVELRLPETAPTSDLEAEEGDVARLFEDEHLVVLNKPAGLAVHPGAGRETGTLAQRLLFHYPEIAAVGGPGRPGIVHRLDLDTTGVMVIARTDAAYLALAAAFAERRVDKHYVAVAHGRLTDTVRVDLPIGRHAQDRKKMTVRRDGRPSISHVSPLAHVGAVASVVSIGLETGRTHQIRVHMKALRHPLVGDPLYGEARWKGAPRLYQRTLERFPRPALHAHRLAFEHPIDGSPMAFEAPVPDDLLALWRKLSGGPWPGDQDT